MHANDQIYSLFWGTGDDPAMGERVWGLSPGGRTGCERVIIALQFKVEVQEDMFIQ